MKAMKTISNVVLVVVFTLACMSVQAWELVGDSEKETQSISMKVESGDTISGYYLFTLKADSEGLQDFLGEVLRINSSSEKFDLELIHPGQIIKMPRLNVAKVIQEVDLSVPDVNEELGSGTDVRTIDVQNVTGGDVLGEDGIATQSSDVQSIAVDTNSSAVPEFSELKAAEGEESLTSYDQAPVLRFGSATPELIGGELLVESDIRKPEDNEGEALLSGNSSVKLAAVEFNEFAKDSDLAVLPRGDTFTQDLTGGSSHIHTTHRSMELPKRNDLGDVQSQAVLLGRIGLPETYDAGSVNLKGLAEESVQGLNYISIHFIEKIKSVDGWVYYAAVLLFFVSLSVVFLIMFLCDRRRYKKSISDLQVEMGRYRFQINELIEDRNQTSQKKQNSSIVKEGMGEIVYNSSARHRFLSPTKVSGMVVGFLKITNHSYVAAALALFYLLIYGLSGVQVLMLISAFIAVALLFLVHLGIWMSNYGEGTKQGRSYYRNRGILRPLSQILSLVVAVLMYLQSEGIMITTGFVFFCAIVWISFVGFARGNKHMSPF